jgi:hypothetical protein
MKTAEDAAYAEEIFQKLKNQKLRIANYKFATG